jgi:hypothetical protein
MTLMGGFVIQHFAAKNNKNLKESQGKSEKI